MSVDFIVFPNFSDNENNRVNAQIKKQIFDITSAIQQLDVQKHELACEIQNLQDEFVHITTISDRNTYRLNRFKQIRGSVIQMLHKLGHQLDIFQIQNDKLILGFKGRLNQVVMIDLCVLETNINMRAQENNHRRQNNQKHIGKAMNRMKESINAQVDVQYVIYCVQLNPLEPCDVDLIEAKRNVETFGGILVDTLNDLERLVQFC